jgi:hypothetical protein
MRDHLKKTEKKRQRKGDTHFQDRLADSSSAGGLGSAR